MHLAVGEFAAHPDDAGELGVVGASDEAGDAGAVAAVHVEIDEHDVGTDAFAEQAGFEVARGGRDLVFGLLGEDSFEHLDDFFVFIDDEDSERTADDAVEGDSVFFHEPD